MSSPSIFALPTSGVQSKFTTGSRKGRKRRRDGGYMEAEDERPSAESSPFESLNDEYTTTITPEERSQRRLAGLSLHCSLPQAPFPHASTSPLASGDREKNISTPFEHDKTASGITDLSLRSQHMATMMAILHRSMLHHDYIRARRALGLILRNEVDGRPIDIRSGGLWEIGAEILLRYDSMHSDSNRSREAMQQGITRSAFEQAKSYYDILIIQYPPHKTWPNATNSLDVCLALYSLWVYVAYQESLQLQRHHEEKDYEPGYQKTASLLQTKTWELEQAKKIGDAMDNRMRDVIYREHSELIRLRGMLALWIADLFQTCSDLVEESIGPSGSENDGARLSDNVEHVYIEDFQSMDVTNMREEEKKSRSLAEDLFDRLRLYPDD